MASTANLLRDLISPGGIASPQIRYEVETRLELFSTLCGLSSRSLPQDFLRKFGNEPPLSFASEIYFVNRMTAQAIATDRDGRPIVIIYLALPFILRALYLALMSEEQILADLPDVRCADCKLLDRKSDCDWQAFFALARGFSFDRFIRWGNELSLTGLPPNDEGRSYLAVMLSLQAETFIVSHELGHIAMGHVDFLKGKRKTSEYVEFGGFYGLSQNVLVRHAFELEADRYAVAKMFEGFFNVKIFGGDSRVSENFLNLNTMGSYSRHRLWLTMAGSVFLLFAVLGNVRPWWAKWLGDSQTKILPGTQDSHPPPLFRLRQFIKHTNEFFVASDQAEGECRSRAINDALRDLSFLAKRMQIGDLFQSIGSENDKLEKYDARIMEARSAIGREMSIILRKVKPIYSR